MNMRVYLDRESAADVYALYVLRDSMGERFAVTINGDVAQEHKIESEFAKIPPFLRVSGPMARILFPALVEAISNHGFDKPTESMLRGKCEAMSAHLQDLQVLLKLKARP